MSATQAADFLTQAVAATILVMAFVAWLRDRSSSNRDVFLFFVTLVSGSTLSLLDRVIPVPGVLWEVATSLLIIHPYFVVRVLYSMRAVPTQVVWFASAGAVLSLVWYFFVMDDANERDVFLVLVIAYIAVTDIYAGYAMLRGALNRGGLSALRMRLGSLGLALVGLVMVLLALRVFAPALDQIISILIPTTSLTAVSVLFLAFGTPRWLARQALRTVAARFAQQRAMGVVRQRNVDEVLAALVEWSADVTGGKGACLARWTDDGSERLHPVDGDTGWLQGRALGPEDAWAWRVWTTQIGSLVEVRELNAELAKALARNDVTHLYAVPVSGQSGVGGVLIVPLAGRPLFPADELRLLQMLTQLTIMELGYAFMREQQDRLIGELSTVNEQLLETNKELESFSYTVSHDLRSPLRAINGFVGMLLAEEPDLSAESIHRLDVVRESATKLGKLVDGLLEFSRLGRQSVDPEPVDLAAVIREAVDDVMAVVPPDRNVTVNIAPSIPRCSGDSLLLKQVFANLVSNAVKFTTPVEHARIDIDVVQSQAPDHVTVRVKDNGIGFDMRYADKIFGVFERMHESREYDGTGIGLALVHRIVSRHGGMIWASAVLGQGASFYVALPAAGVPPVDAPAAALPFIGRGERVLNSVTNNQGETA